MTLFIRNSIVALVLMLCLSFFGIPVAYAQGAGNTDFVFPPSSIADFSLTLERPAGRRGFLRTAPNGRFVWSDGSRARFWGINVSSTRLNIPHTQIEQVVKNFARAGINMVRLEAIDNRNCLLGKVDAPDSLNFDPEYFDRINYWMHTLRSHGIYYYLDLLDFRTFKLGDGVLNADKMDRAARPYALFDRHLINLQKDFATKLLTRQNRYSGFRPVDDPAFALVEIFNEHGFFLYPELLETMVEPYATNLRIRWNEWLQEKYGSTARLKNAWGKVGEISVLVNGEELESKSVSLPILANLQDQSGKEVTKARKAATRQRDGVEFLVVVQREYFREIRDHLRSIGVKIPITAIVSNDIPWDVQSVAEELDFTSENWYGEGVNGDPRTPGVTYYTNRNSVAQDNGGGYAPFTAILRWNNKPVVIREWATTWPNRYRAVSMAEALGYSSLQDYDVVLLFGYQTNRAPNGSEANALNDFAFQVDPTVWGLHALAGQSFLRQDIQPAKNTVSLTYRNARQFAWSSRNTDLRRVAYVSKMNQQMSNSSLGALEPVVTNTTKDLQTLNNVLATLKKRSPSVNKNAMKDRLWTSDTGQIIRNTSAGRILLNTPNMAMLAGPFAPNQAYTVGPFRFTTPTNFGAIMAIALDGVPISRSRHIVLKMVSVAENTGQLLTTAPKGSIAPWVLKQRGAAPMTTLGKPSSIPTKVWFVGQENTPKEGKAVPPPNPILILYLENGTWELDMKDGKAKFQCDTPQIRGNLQGREFTTDTTIQEIVQSPIPRNQTQAANAKAGKPKRRVEVSKK